MAKKQTINIETLNEIALSVNKIGIKKTHELLNTAQKDPINTVVRLLISDTCKQYCMSKELLFKFYSNGIRLSALSTIIYLLAKHLKLQSSQIFSYIPELKVNRSRLSQYITYMLNLSEKIKCEKEVLNHLAIIEEKMLINIENSKK
ncbi:MAG: hypothetical protein HC892_09945 [Saprospiraceae bacterium]|nr:hypothetical protein [Saprospiraceae bacterium]